MQFLVYLSSSVVTFVTFVFGFAWIFRLTGGYPLSHYYPVSIAIGVAGVIGCVVINNQIYDSKRRWYLSIVAPAFVLGLPIVSFIVVMLAFFLSGTFLKHIALYVACIVSLATMGYCAHLVEKLK